MDDIGAPKKYLEIETKLLSKCHSAPQILILSRAGGLVTQNCTACGKPAYVNPSDFPDMGNCDCGRALTVWKVDKNYVWGCEKCNRGRMVAEIVPAWEDYFPRHGIAAPGDESWRR